MDLVVLDTYVTGLRVVSEHRCNVLLEGAVADTDAALRMLRSRLDHLPADEARSFILSDAASLTRDDQRRLLDWMNGAGSGTQIISTVARPLFELVLAGLFDAVLYYRLNVVTLRVGAGSSSVLG